MNSINQWAIYLSNTVNEHNYDFKDAVLGKEKQLVIGYFLKTSLTCLTNEIFVPLYRELVRLHLE